MFEKTFNRSERAAFLALGELYKQGLVDERVFGFKTSEVCPVNAVKTVDGKGTFLHRQIIFNGLVEVFITVNALAGQGYSDENPSEEIAWKAPYVLHSEFVEKIWTTKIFDRQQTAWVAKVIR